MKKKVNLIGLGILLINFTSAYGSYNSFNIKNLLDSIDSQTMLLLIAIIIPFALIFWSLSRSRFFRDKYGNPNRAIAGVIAFSISMFTTWGINKTNFDIQNLFYSVGIPEGMLPTLIPIILISTGEIKVKCPKQNINLYFKLKVIAV